MRKYNVYGLGNALVDYEIRVEPEFLQENGIDKGVMTLIEEDRKNHLLEKCGPYAIERSCGGSAANTVIGLSQFGGKAFYSCKVANDEVGDFYTTDLTAKGVSTNLVGERPSGVTGKCLVFVTPDADRTMNTYLGITSEFSTSELDHDAIGNSEYVYIEGYLVASPTGQKAAVEACKIAREKGVKTAISLSDPNMVNFFRDNFIEIYNNEKFDLLFCNESEALDFTKTKSVDAAIEALKFYAHNFAVTLGPKGALLFDGGKIIEVETEKVDAVDSNGAGDLFAGAFLYGITNDYDYEKAGRLACRAAAKLVTSYGARLPDEDITSLL